MALLAFPEQEDLCHIADTCLLWGVYKVVSGICLCVSCRLCHYAFQD